LTDARLSELSSDEKIFNFFQSFSPVLSKGLEAPLQGLKKASFPF